MQPYNQKTKKKKAHTFLKTHIYTHKTHTIRKKRVFLPVPKLCRGTSCHTEIWRSCLFWQRIIKWLVGLIAQLHVLTEDYRAVDRISRAVRISELVTFPRVARLIRVIRISRVGMSHATLNSGAAACLGLKVSSVSTVGGCGGRLS
jgi:hypothetical protein